MPEFKPSEFAGRRLQELEDFLQQADADAIRREWEKKVEGHTPPQTRGAAMDKLWEASTQLLTHERNDTQLPADHPQSLVPNVDIKEYIGGGQFGWVYAGLVRTTGLVIAVKVLRNECFESTSLVARRAANEAIIGAKLAHRNIMGIFDLRPVGRFWIILMELVQGK